MFDTDRKENEEQSTSTLFAQAHRYPLLNAEQERAADEEKWQAATGLLVTAAADRAGRALLQRWSEELLQRKPQLENFEQREHYNLLKREQSALVGDDETRAALAALATQLARRPARSVDAAALEAVAIPCVLATGLAQVLLQPDTHGEMAAALLDWIAQWPDGEQPPGEISKDTGGELLALLGRYEAARARLIKHNIRLVYAIAGRLNNRGLPYEDLVQGGMIGLIRAAEKYRSTTGYRFSTYAYNWISQSTRQHIEDMQGILRYPAGVNEQLSRLYRERLDLVQRDGREPDVATLAARMDMTPEAVRRLQQVSNSPVSLDSTYNDDPQGLSLSEILPDQAGEDTGGAAQQQSLRRCLVNTLDSLKSAEREVIILRWGLRQSPPLSRAQIADKLGVSTEWVRQLENTALDKLRQDKGLSDAYEDSLDPVG